MKIRPIDDRVLARREVPLDKTPGGIFIPDTAKEKPQRAKVVAVGEGRLLDSGERAPMQVSEGDTVYFTNYAGSDIEHDGEKFLVLRECDILAVVE